MPGLGCIWRFQVTHVAGESPPARLPTRSKASSRVRGITSFAESYGVLLLSDGDIRHKKPALVSALSSRPGLSQKGGRLQPPHLRALFSPARLQAVLFSGNTSAETGKNRLNSGQPYIWPIRLPPGVIGPFSPPLPAYPSHEISQG